MTNSQRWLAQLQGEKCEAVDAIEYEDPGPDTVYAVGTSIQFTSGTHLNAQFWRLIKGDGPVVSIFDYRQQYGLPAPIGGGDKWPAADGETSGHAERRATISMMVRMPRHSLPSCISRYSTYGSSGTCTNIPRNHNTWSYRGRSWTTPQ